MTHNNISFCILAHVKIEEQYAIFHEHSTPYIRVVCVASGHNIVRFTWNQKTHSVYNSTAITINRMIEAGGKYSFGQNTAMRSVLIVKLENINLTCDFVGKYNDPYECSVIGTNEDEDVSGPISYKCMHTFAVYDHEHI